MHASVTTYMLEVLDYLDQNYKAELENLQRLHAAALLKVDALQAAQPVSPGVSPQL
jgi:hypothetical protein